jgi:hypothetical protein
MGILACELPEMQGLSRALWLAGWLPGHRMPLWWDEGWPGWGIQGDTKVAKDTGYRNTFLLIGEASQPVAVICVPGALKRSRFPLPTWSATVMHSRRTFIHSFRPFIFFRDVNAAGWPLV